LQSIDNKLYAFLCKEKGMRKPKELPEGALESLAKGLIAGLPMY
jgi:hypothetical protein